MRMAQSHVSSRVPWEQVCKMLEKVQTSQRQRKRDMLQRFIQQYKSMLKDYENAHPQSQESFFPVLRILLPSLDRERGAYGVKEKKLADLYIRILGLKKDGTDAQKLLNYNKPKTGGGSVGDFAEVAYSVMRDRCPEKGELSLDDVDKHLTVIADRYFNKGNTKDVEDSLLYLMRHMTATEQKWLIRVLLKEMHLGISESTIFNEWHPDAKVYYDVTNSLLKVCLTLKDRDKRMNEIEISLFSPFRPMLSDRVVLDRIEAQMNHKTYYSEIKFDGERSQIHKSESKYKYFSRNGFDFTTNFGGTPNQGLFTPHIHHLFTHNVTDIILDGEMVVWSKKHKAIIPKSVNLDFKNIKENGDWQACYCPFDILYLNGEVLTGRPLRERILKLSSVIQNDEGRLMISRQLEVKTKDDVINRLNEAIDDREEGIVLKDPESTYQPASRKGGWIKVKPDYVDSMVPELDLVIIGGYYGTGRKKGVIAKFLLAVLSPHGSTQEFHSMTQVASGYTDIQLEKLVTQLSQSFVKRQPSNVKISKEKPDVWFEPEKSTVLQVKGAELTRTSHFKTGITLRFPRVEFIRDDKLFNDILTLEELEKMYEDTGGKFAGKYDTVEPEKRSSNLKRKLPLRAVANNLQPPVASTTKQSDILRGKQLCVIMGGRAERKHGIERQIIENGGTCTQHPNKQTYCVIAETISIKVQNLIKAGTYNIIKLDWLLECLHKKKIVQWGPIDVIFLGETERQKMATFFDQFGDSYFDPVDAARLKRIMNHMVDKDWEPLCQLDMHKIDQELGGINYGLFRTMHVFVDENVLTGAEKSVPLKLKLFGAQISRVFDESVTHVLHADRQPNVDFGSCRSVTCQWVGDCIDANKVL